MLKLVLWPMGIVIFRICIFGYFISTLNHFHLWIARSFSIAYSTWLLNFLIFISILNLVYYIHKKLLWLINFSIFPLFLISLDILLQKKICCPLDVNDNSLISNYCMRDFKEKNKWKWLSCQSVIGGIIHSLQNQQMNKNTL